MVTVTQDVAGGAAEAGINAEATTTGIAAVAEAGSMAGGGPPVGEDVDME